MRLLELFSGTKSVGKVAETLGYEVTSLDLKNADINTDILNWDYKIYDPKHFHVIWASPPCTEYSRALTTKTRQMNSANQIVLKTFEIIDGNDKATVKNINCATNANLSHQAFQC